MRPTATSDRSAPELLDYAKNQPGRQWRNLASRIELWTGHVRARSVRMIYVEACARLSGIETRTRRAAAYAVAASRKLPKSCQAPKTHQFPHPHQSMPNIISATVSQLPPANCYSKIRDQRWKRSACPRQNHADACRPTGPAGDHAGHLKRRRAHRKVYP